MPTSTKWFETENGVAIGDSILIKDDAGKTTFSDIEITAPKTLKNLITASENTFSNLTNGFIATDVQGAIEEAAGRIQYVVSINRNSTMSNGDWFGRNEVMPNTSSHVASRNVKLLGISWSNTTVNADFDLEFYKNGRATTKFRTYQARGLNYGYASGWANNFSAGDFIDIKYIDQGSNSSDMCLDLVFLVVG